LPPVKLASVAKGAADVQRQLALAPERRQHRQRDRAARAAVEAVARPDLAPRVAGDEVLERGREPGRPPDRRIDVGVAQDLAARPLAVAQLAGLVDFPEVQKCHAFI